MYGCFIFTINTPYTEIKDMVGDILYHICHVYTTRHNPPQER